MKAQFLLVCLLSSACSTGPRTPTRPSTPTTLFSDGDKVATITRDGNGVAHIRATDEIKLMAGWGYVHGMDRMWQMDFLHRLALGGSAEVYGRQTIKTDFFVRLMGLAAKVKEVTKNLEGSYDYRLLEAYSAGVNRSQAELSNDLAHQFKVFNIRPLSWSPEASILLAFLQSLDMTTRTFATDAQAAVARDRLGQERFDELFLTSSELAAFSTSIIRPEDLGVPPPPPVQRGPDMEAGDGPSTSGGSNVWALTGTRTTSGNTIVANDTHLSMRNPSTWHEVHLQLADKSINAYGYAVAGVPILPAGFTPHLSWGVTLGYTNAMDLVAYPLSGDGNSYLGESGKRVEIREISPDVRTRLGPIVAHVFWKKFKVSSEGIVYPLDVQGKENTVYVLKWSALFIDSIGIKDTLQMLRSKNVREMYDLLGAWPMPSFNFVFGDRDGGVGFRQVGLTPKRKDGVQGVTKGDDASQRWEGFVSAEDMPGLLNPSRGYIVSSNNTPTPTGRWKGTYLGEGYRRGFRARRIEEMIEAKEKHSLEDVQKMQMDVLVPEARILLPLMLEQFDPRGDKQLEAVKNLVSRWDKRATVDSPAMSIFSLWVTALKDVLFEKEIRLLEDVPFSEFTYRPPVDALYRTLKGTTKSSNNLEESLRQSLKAVLEKLRDELGAPRDDFSNWRWGNYHQLTFVSLSGDPRWELGPYPLGGSARTVAKATENGEGPFGVKSAASMRFIVELSDPPVARGSLPGPNRDQEFSSTPASIRDWVNGKLRPFYFTDAEIKENHSSVQVLKW